MLDPTAAVLCRLSSWRWALIFRTSRRMSCWFNLPSLANVALWSIREHVGGLIHAFDGLSRGVGFSTVFANPSNSVSDSLLGPYLGSLIGNWYRIHRYHCTFFPPPLQSRATTARWSVS